MRFRSLGRHTAGLSIFAAMMLAAAPALAQSSQQAICGGDGSAANYEIGMRFNQGTHLIRIYNVATGALVDSRIANATSPVYGQCHWVAHTDGEGANTYPERVYLDANKLYRIDIGDIASYYYNQCGPGSAASVFCPRGNVGIQPDVNFYVTSNTIVCTSTCPPTTGSVRVVPASLPDGNTYGVDDFLPGGSWVLPYDYRAICASPTSTTSTTSTCDPNRDQGLVFLTPTARTSAPPVGLPLVLTSAPNADWQIPAGRTTTWSADQVSTVRFKPGGRLTVNGTLDVSGATLTATNAAAGWAGVRFNPGSGGAWTGGFVEYVAGDDPNAVLKGGAAAITVDGASASFSGVRIEFPVAGTELTGLQVTGSAAAVTATDLIVRGMTGSGVVVNGGARLDLFRGEITGSDGYAVVTAGTGTKAYLRRALSGDFRGTQITSNEGGGLAASSSAGVWFGTDNLSAPGYGYASVTGNGTTAGRRGIVAQTGADVYAGAGTVGSGSYQRNRVFGNGGASATGNAYAAGTGSTVYARCNWWNTTDPAQFRVGTATGGFLDASYYLTADPYTTASPGCTNLIIRDRGAGGSAGTARGGETAGRGTEEAEAEGLDRLAEAMSAGPAEAVGLLAALVAEMPGTDAAVAAVGEAAGIAGRPGAPPSAGALLDDAAGSTYGPLRSAGWQGLVAARHARGDLAGALAAASALAAEGGASAVQAEIARVYLHAAAGDSTAALGALAALEALAPGSVEAELARAFLGGEEAVGRGVGAPAAEARGAAAEARGTAASEPAAFALALSPNPAGSSSWVTLTLAEPADVAVTVYDVLGRAVAVPLQGALAAGAHRAAVDVAALAPGVYVVRATANTAGVEVVRTARLTVAR